MPRRSKEQLLQDSRNARVEEVLQWLLIPCYQDVARRVDAHLGEYLLAEQLITSKELEMLRETLSLRAEYRKLGDEDDTE